MAIIPSELSLTRDQVAENMKAPTKIVSILGGTGKAGGWILEMALERGYTVRALARSPKKLEKYSEVQVIQGGLEEEPVRELLTGSDVVICALGSPNHDTLVVEKGAKVLCQVIETMDKKPRLVFMTSVGINEAIPQGKKYGCSKHCCPSCSCCCGYGFMGCCIMNCLIPKIIGQGLWNDMGFAEDIIRKSEVVSSTTIVRPTNMWPANTTPAFSEEWRKEGGSTGYLTKTAEDSPPNMWISRKAISSFCLDCVEDGSFDGKAVSLFQGNS